MKYIVAVIDSNDVVLDTWLYQYKVTAVRKLHQDFLMMMNIMKDNIKECSASNDYAKMIFNDGNFIEWFIMEADNKK